VCSSRSSSSSSSGGACTCTPPHYAPPKSAEPAPLAADRTAEKANVRSPASRPRGPQSFIHAATRLPAKRLAKRSPVVPMGKYEIMYHSSATSCAMAAMSVRIVLCNYPSTSVS
jgi:hypothetical protein